MRDIDQMREFAAAPSPPMARASSGTLPLCPITVVGVDPVAIHRRPTVVVVVFAALLRIVILLLLLITSNLLQFYSGVASATA
jgi:hypothetical protein